jgi:hypothetical protein
LISAGKLCSVTNKSPNKIYMLFILFLNILLIQKEKLSEKAPTFKRYKNIQKQIFKKRNRFQNKPWLLSSDFQKLFFSINALTHLRIFDHFQKTKKHKIDSNLFATWLLTLKPFSKSLDMSHLWLRILELEPFPIVKQRQIFVMLVVDWRSLKLKMTTCLFS